jgi:putative hemolysin
MNIIAQNIGIMAVMFLLLCCSAFFSGTETALFSLSRYQLLELEQEDRKSSKIILTLMHDSSNTLVSILLGNLTVNILFFCLSTIIAELIGSLYGTFLQVVFGIIVLGIIIICGEILPKALGLKFSLFIARASCYPIFIWLRISTPIRKVVSFIVSLIVPQKCKSLSNVSEAELKFLLEVSEKKGAINETTSDMIEDIISMSTLRAKHIMIPRIDIIQCAERTTLDGAIKKAKRNDIFLLPVFRNTKGEINGYLDIKKLCLSNINRTAKVKDLMNEIEFVPETKNVAELLNEMLNKELKIIFVVDEYGDITGMITREKILKEITGEIGIEQEASGIPLVKKLNNNEYRIQGTLSFNDWRELFAEDLSFIKEFNVASVGGFVVSLLGRNPKIGDVVNFKNLSFEVEKVVKNRIITLILRII